MPHPLTPIWQAMLLGIFTTSVIIGSCASLLASMGKQAAAKQDHFDRLNSSLSYHKVGLQVSSRVRAFIEYLYASGNMGTEDLYRFRAPIRIRPVGSDQWEQTSGIRPVGSDLWDPTSGNKPVGSD